MNTKKFLSCLLASAMMCGVLVSCGDSDDSSKSSESKQTTTEATTEAETTKAETDEQDATSEPQAVAVDDTEFEEAVEPESGDAYLAIADSQWWIQYMGTKEGQLTYDAGVAHIDGNGDYTVSVTADTNGFRYDTTGDVNDQYVPSGCVFSAVIIKGYGDFKVAVGEAVADNLAPVRTEFDRLISDKAYLKECYTAGAAKAQKYSQRIVSKVYHKVGFVDFR